MSEKTRKNLECSIGISLEKLHQMTPDEVHAWIEKKIGCPLKFSKKRRHGVMGRGNPLLARRKLRTKEDLDRKSKELFGV